MQQWCMTKWSHFIVQRVSFQLVLVGLHWSLYLSVFIPRLSLWMLTVFVWFWWVHTDTQMIWKLIKYFMHESCVDCGYVGIKVMDLGWEQATFPFSILCINLRLCSLNEVIRGLLVEVELSNGHSIWISCRVLVQLHVRNWLVKWYCHSSLTYTVLLCMRDNL